MAIKFRVLRAGDKSDIGPNGEPGFVINGSDGTSDATATVLCLVDHVHQKNDCAQALLGDGKGSLRERLTAEIEAKAGEKVALDVKLAAVVIEPFRTKEVDVVEKGKVVTKTIDDVDLA